MSKHKLEYIWLDGYQPTQSLRSKTLVREDFSGNLEDAPDWNFDGSSTEQATDRIRCSSRWPCFQIQTALAATAGW